MIGALAAQPGGCQPPDAPPPEGPPDSENPPASPPADLGGPGARVTADNIGPFAGDLNSTLAAAVTSLVQQLPSQNLGALKIAGAPARALHEHVASTVVPGTRGNATIRGSRYLQHWPARYELTIALDQYGAQSDLTLNGNVEFNVVVDDSTDPPVLHGLYRGALGLYGSYGGAIDAHGQMVDGQSVGLKLVSEGAEVLYGRGAPPSFITFVSTIAGTGELGSADGPGATATFHNPTGVIVDEEGVIYVADSRNGAIREIDLNGNVSTVIDGLEEPQDLGIDGLGYLIVSLWSFDRPIVRVGRSGLERGSLSEILGKVGKDGAFPLCPIGATCDGRTPIAATHYPAGLDVTDNIILFAQGWSPPSLRAVLPDGYAITLHDSSGNCGALGTIGGTADVAIGNRGEMYFVNNTYGCYGVLVREPDGTLRTLAGDLETFGQADGVGTAAQFFNPAGLIFDGERYLYVADTTNALIRRVDIETGEVLRVAGCLSHTEGFDCTSQSGFRDGPGDYAQFSNTSNLDLDRWGDLYVADETNHAIRFIRIIADPQRVPLIHHFDPVALQQGDSADMVIQGRNLALTETVNLGEGVTTEIERTGYSRVELKVTAAADAPATSRTLSLTTPYGTFTTPEGQSFTVLGPPSGGVQVTTISGTGELFPDQVNLGPAGQSTFAFPTGMAAIDRDRLLVADPLEHRIRLIATRVGAVDEISQLLIQSATGADANVLSTILGSLGVIGDALSALGISDAWTEQQEDKIRDYAKKAVDEMCDTVGAENCEWLSLPWAGVPFTPGKGGGHRLSATFFLPTDIWYAGEGRYYVADTGNQTVRVIGFDPEEQKDDDNMVHPGPSLPDYPFAVTAKDDAVYTVLPSENVLGLYNVSPDPGFNQEWSGVRGLAQCEKGPGDARHPLGIPLGAAAKGDFVYVADPFCKTIWRIDQANGGEVHNIHGDIPYVSTGKCADGPASLATFGAPMDVAVDIHGRILVADCGCNSIRVIQDIGFGQDYDQVAARLNEFLGKHNSRLSTTTLNAIQEKLSTGDTEFLDANRYWVYTLAGSSDGAPGYQDGPAHSALFNGPTSIATVSDTDHTFVYVGDTGNRRIRRIYIP